MDTQLNAINAYQHAGNLSGNAASSAASGDFAGMVSNVVDETVNSVVKGEQMTAASLTGGNVGLEELAIAVNNAEVALKTVVAVRDRMISAYQDIMKMPI